MPEVFSKSKWEKEADRLAAEWKQPTVGGSADPEPFRASRTKAIPVTRGGNDIFQTDEHGVQYFTFEGWKEHQEAATAWMELAGHAFDHMAGGFTRDPVKYDPERHGTGAFSLQMGSDRIVAGGEAGLRAVDGIWDFIKGGAKFASRPFQSEKTVDRVKYDQYLELTAKMNALYGVWKKDGQLVPPGTEGAMKVKSPETFAGNMRRAVYGEGDKEAAAIDQMIDPQAADSWSMVLDPLWLIPAGGLAKAQKLLATGARGEKLAAALNKVKNLVPEGGKLSAAAQWAKDAAKATGGVVRNPATRAVGGAGRLVAGAGKGSERLGAWSGSRYLAFGGGAYAGYGAIESDRTAFDIIQSVAGGYAAAKAIPTVLAKKGAALRGVGEFTRGTARVAEVGTFGRAIQSGMYSAGTNKALKLMDNAPLNAIAHRSGQLANLITKGSAFGAGMGYVIADKEGAAAGLGVGVLGAPIGALQAKLISGAVKFPFYKKNKEGKWEKTDANSILDVPHQDLVDNFLAHMSESDREALLTPKEYEDGTIVHMTQEKLYSMALLDAYAKGILKKGKDGPEGDLVIRYMDDSDIRAEFPDQPDWIGKQGIHRAEVDGKPLIIISRNADDPLRTLAHELFHPDWKTADGDDPLTGLRAEMQNHLFGVRDGADGVIFDGLFNEKEFLSLENQYLSRLHDPKSKKGKEGYEEHMRTRNMQQRREYIAGELLSESFGNFAEAAGGDVVAHGRRILRGAKVDKVTAFVTGGLATKFDLGLLGRMRQALGKMGIEFDSAGTPASSIFKDPTTGKKKWTLVDGKRVSFKEGGEGLTNSPEMNKLIADYVVAKDKVLERLTIRTEGVDEKAVITAKQILEKNDPVLVQKFANTGMFKLDNDGNVVFEGGAPVLRSRTERKLNEETQSGAIFAALDAIARVEFDSEGMVRKENEKGDVSYTGRFMNEEQLSAVLSLPDEVLPRSVKNKISKLNEMMTKGFDDAGNLVGDHSPNFLIQYYAATKGSKYTSKASMSHQLAAPYGWSISQAGNFNLTTLSVGRFEAKIKSWWKKAGESKGGRHRAFTELFDGSQEQFRADVVEYLHNQAAGRPNPMGAKKDAIADFLNALSKEQKDVMPNRLSTDKEHVVPVSLRVDRMESIQSSLGTPMPVNYARLRVNYKPTTPKGDEGARYMPAGKGDFKVHKTVTGSDGWLFRDGTFLNLGDNYSHEGGIIQWAKEQAGTAGIRTGNANARKILLAAKEGGARSRGFDFAARVVREKFAQFDKLWVEAGSLTSAQRRAAKDWGIENGVEVTHSAGSRNTTLHEPEGRGSSRYMPAGNKPTAPKGDEGARYMPKGAEGVDRPHSPKARKMLKGLQEGKKLNRKALDRAIEEEHPIKEVSVPRLKDLPTETEMYNALNKTQREKIGLLDQIESNESITIRQDVDSMANHGVGVVTVKGKNVTTYENFVRISDPQLITTEAMQRTALDIGAGGQKRPTIAIKGKKHPRQIIPRNMKDWTQVGFNPDRHSFYYDRKTGEPIVGGTEAVQIGNTVFVKNALSGKKSDFLFMPAGKDIEVAPGLVRAKVDSEFKLSKPVLAQYMPAGKKVDIMAYADRDMFTLAADNLVTGIDPLVGPTGAKMPVGVEAQGGRGFQFLNPKKMIWAFKGSGTATTLLKRGLDVSGGKNTVIVGVTSQGSSTHFNSPYGLYAFAKSLEAAANSKTFPQRRVDQHIKDLMTLVGRTKDDKFTAGQRNAISNIKGLASLLRAVTPTRANPQGKIGFHAAGIIKEKFKQIGKLKKAKLEIIQPELEAAGLHLDALMHDLSDPGLRGTKIGDVVALVELDLTKAPKKTDFHFSYPWTIEGKPIGFLKKFPNVRDLTSDTRIYTKRTGQMTSQPLQTVMPEFNRLKSGEVSYMPAGKSGGEVFYSNSAKALESPKVPKAANGPAMLNAMIKGGANLQEMKWMDLDRFLMDHKGKVTKEQVQDFINTNQIQVVEKVRSGKGGLEAEEIQYLENKLVDLNDELTGLKNYDDSRSRQQVEEVEAEIFNAEAEISRAKSGGETLHGGGDHVLPGAKKGSYRELQLMLPRNKGETFIGPEAHWGKDENVFASVRFNERTDADGKRMLFIEEVQSDWVAKGRDLGFDEPFINGDIVGGPTESVPAAPFVSKRKGGKHVEDSKWRALAFKRILRWASDEGFSRVGWINGTDTAKRYNLSKKLDSVEWQRMPGEDTVHITALDKEGKAVISDKPVNINKLKNTVGRELSEKILASDKVSGEFTGLELEVGGEWHKQFYDVDLPNYVRKYVKKWGGEVGEVGIDVGGVNAARDTKGKSTFNTTAHYTDITPSVKKSVVEGQSLFMPASGKMDSKQFKEWFKGSSIVGKDKNPLVVYHGSREGAGVIDEFKTPAFFSPDKMAADWYGDSRPYYLNIKNPAGYNDIIKAAKKAGVKDVGGEYPEVAKHSPYDGTNENDLVYIPKVREQLKSMGFDGYRAWDWLGNSEIDAIVAFDKSQIRYKSEKPSADKQLRLERDLKKKKRN